MQQKSTGKIKCVEFTYPQTTSKAQVGVIISLKSLLKSDGWTVTTLTMKRTIGWKLTKGAQRNSIMISKNMKSQLVVGVLLAARNAPAPSPGGASVKLNKKAFAPRERIYVTFTAPPGWKSNAWVGIIPSRIPHGSERRNDSHDVAYKYLKRRTAGTLIFKAPRRPGSYDIRMHTTDDNGREAASVTFSVQ